MGEGRDQFLSGLTDKEIDEEMTHWFVAIEGSLKSEDPEYFQWKVIVFPSREDGSYKGAIQPYYESKQFDTINESFNYSRAIINHLKEGQIQLSQLSS